MLRAPATLDTWGSLRPIHVFRLLLQLRMLRIIALTAPLLRGISHQRRLAGSGFGLGSLCILKMRGEGGQLQQPQQSQYVALQRAAICHGFNPRDRISQIMAVCVDDGREIAGGASPVQVFTAELVFNMALRGFWGFFVSGWNIFDFVIILGACTPHVCLCWEEGDAGTRRGRR